MTVSELIEALEELSSDSEVYLLKDGANATLGEGEKVIEEYEIIGHSECSEIYIEAE